MTASVQGLHHFSGAAAETKPHIRLQPVVELDSPTETVYSTSAADLGHQQQQQPWVEVLEQPKPTAMRFRYVCEGRSAGTILGVNATVAQKTYPAIRINNAGPAAVVVVSCVTKDPPYYPHPHNLVGSSCENGVCTMRVKAGVNTISMMNVGIQCCKRNDIQRAVHSREGIRVDPFGTGYVTDLEKLDLSAVRLCFQVFLMDNNKRFSIVVPPAVSDPIIDKKLVHNLGICRLSRRTCSAKGGDEVILLCDKIKKEDIEVRFYEEDIEGEMIWQAFGTFTAADIHHQCAISFKAPAYRCVDVESPVTVQIQLRQPSDGTLGEPKDFQYIPNGHDDDQPNVTRKRQRLDKQFIPRLHVTERDVITTSMASDAKVIIPYPASSGSSRTSAYNQLAASDVRTVSDDSPTKTMTQSQDGPMDYSVTSGWIQSANTTPANTGNAALPKDAQQLTADPQGGNAQQPVMYFPTAGVLADGTVQVHLTEDGRLILPPGVKLLYTADGQEVVLGGTAAAVDGQEEQVTRPADDASSDHVQPSKPAKNSSDQHHSATDDQQTPHREAGSIAQ